MIENSINSQTDVTASVKHSGLLLIRIVQKDYLSQLRWLLKIILKCTKHSTIKNLIYKNANTIKLQKLLKGQAINAWDN